MRAALSSTVPDEHWGNVGRVAVHAAWLEEAAALIRYASEGGWDMTYTHLKFASSKQGLFRALRKLADDLPESESRTLVRATGELKAEHGVVKRRLSEFIERSLTLLERRDRVVHSVPWYGWFSEGMQAVHPRSINGDLTSAVGPLPTTEECNALVREFEAAAEEGQWLAPRVGALLAGT